MMNSSGNERLFRIFFILSLRVLGTRRQESLMVRILPIPIIDILKRHLSRWIYPEIFLLSRLVNKHGIFMDVGANIGNFTLALAQIAGLVVSFEPIPSTFLKLYENCRRNKIKNVKLIQCAVGDRNTTDAIFMSRESPHMKSSFSSYGIGESNSIMVKVVNLDDFLPSMGLESVDLMKIDVEGAEFEVLKGARQLIIRNKPEILCELHPSQLKDRGYSLRMMKDFMHRLGYNVFSLERNLSRIELDDDHFSREHLLFTGETTPNIDPFSRIWLSILSISSKIFNRQ